MQNDLLGPHSPSAEHALPHDFHTPYPGLRAVLYYFAVFCFFYCYDGLLRERKFELLAFVGATVVIIIYIVGNYIFDAARHKDIVVIKTVSPVHQHGLT